MSKSLHFFTLSHYIWFSSLSFWWRLLVINYKLYEVRDSTGIGSWLTGIPELSTDLKHIIDVQKIFAVQMSEMKNKKESKDNKNSTHCEWFHISAACYLKSLPNLPFQKCQMCLFDLKIYELHIFLITLTLVLLHKLFSWTISETVWWTCLWGTHISFLPNALKNL